MIIIKDLVWRTLKGLTQHVAETPLRADYWIVQRPDTSKFAASFLDYARQPWMAEFDTLEEAKQACQYDFASRITPLINLEIEIED